MKKIPEIQYITRNCDHYSHAEQAAIMFAKGIKWVQLRMKDHKESDIIDQAEQAMVAAKKYDALLIINDSISIAQKVGAHGVHVGLNDTPVHEAREALGENAIIGGTANTLQEILLQLARGANYVGVGPLRFTTTKKKLSPVIGLEGYKEFSNKLKEKNILSPLVAVGGITMDEIPELLHTGVQGVAISGALWNLHKPKK